MGCCMACCARPGPNDGPVNYIKPKAIIVWRAQGLKNGDVLDRSDPYVIVRIGEAGSTWKQKPRSAGRRGNMAKGNNPEWNLGLTVETAGITSPEVHVRVFDMEFVKEDDFLGEATAPLASLSDAESELLLTGGTGSIFLSAGEVGLLEAKNIKPWAGYEDIAPMGALKSWDVADAANTSIPLIVGTAPLPPNLRGIFWLMDQKTRSALMSFGGPSRDGGGCSTGNLVGNIYSVRVSGDRTWSFGDNRDEVAIPFAEISDLVYHFAFDDGTNPTKCQIYPELRTIGVIWQGEFLLDFEMEFMPEGDEQFPGSVTWKRPSFVAGKLAYEYTVTQVIDENGNRIEPAWSKFVEYQQSPETGADPGKIFYREIPTEAAANRA